MSVFAVMTISEIKELANGFGCDVVVASPNELQFDLDSKEAQDHFEMFYFQKLINRYKGNNLPRREWKSKSGNSHVIVTLPGDLTVEERIALQTQGGSDYGREFAALCCHWDGSPHPILLFRPRNAEIKELA